MFRPSKLFYHLFHEVSSKLHVFVDMSTESSYFLIDTFYCIHWVHPGWESSDVFRFDLASLLQGQTRMAKLKSAYNSLIIGLRGLQCETNL